MPFCSHSVLTPSPQTHACGNRPHRGRRSCAKCRDHCTCPPRDPTEGRDAATHTKNLSQPGDANALRASTPQSCSCLSEPSDPWSECCSHCSLQLSAGRERRDATTFYRQKEHLPPVVTLVRSAREGDHRFAPPSSILHLPTNELNCALPSMSGGLLTTRYFAATTG